jgi:hypothetical protein
VRKHPQVVGQWHTLVEGFSTSSLDFYELVKAGIAKRQLPDLKISQVTWKESGLGSAKRIYLRVSRESLNFDICAAPFGTGYFFSWWLARISRTVLDLLVILLTLAATAWSLRSLMGEMGENQEAPGCASLALGPAVILAVLYLLGALIRYGNLGLEPTVLSMPITGFIYGLVFRPVTYFNEDTATMFRESVHNAVVEAIDTVTAAKGLRALSEAERKVSVGPYAKER